jgi:hypothetical protein
MPKRGKKIGPREMTNHDRQDISRGLDAAGGPVEYIRWVIQVWQSGSNFDEFMLQQLAAMEETWKYQSRALLKEKGIKPIAREEYIRRAVTACLPTLADRQMAEIDSVVKRIARADNARKRGDKARS